MRDTAGLKSLAGSYHELSVALSGRLRCDPIPLVSRYGKASTMRTTKSFGAVSLLVLLAGGVPGQELPPASMQYGAFGFPDPSGTRLLTVSDLLQPAMFHMALCSGGIPGQELPPESMQYGAFGFPDPSG